MKRLITDGIPTSMTCYHCLSVLLNVLVNLRNENLINAKMYDKSNTTYYKLIEYTSILMMS